jgi:hypothetical protein
LTEDDKWFRSLELSKPKTEEEIRRISKVLEMDEKTTKSTMEALASAGAIGAEALRIHKEMDTFMTEHAEWLTEEKRQLAARDEDLSGKD